MKRPLIYLAVFSLFFWTSWLALAFLTAPTKSAHTYNVLNVSLFFILFFGGAVCLTALIVSAYKATKPNRKLPSLLIKDSLNQGYIIATWLTGLLVLQLLRSATLINVALWVIILLASEWTLHLMQKSKVRNQPLEDHAP